MIPCIEIKCLKYPVCKQKTLVTCDLLREYCNELTLNKFPNNNPIWMNWKDMGNSFPKLLGVEKENNKWFHVSNTNA